jgi:hypothetical protein
MQSTVTSSSLDQALAIVVTPTALGTCRLQYKEVHGPTSQQGYSLLSGTPICGSLYSDSLQFPTDGFLLQVWQSRYHGRIETTTLLDDCLPWRHCQTLVDGELLDLKTSRYLHHNGPTDARKLAWQDASFVLSTCQAWFPRRQVLHLVV